MSQADRMKELVVAAGLDVQHSCKECGVTLDSFGRQSTKYDFEWVCPDHRALADGSRVLCAEKAKPSS